MQKLPINSKSILDTPAKPFLKWAGGKGQLLDKFFAFYPRELKSGDIENYYEPFIGGGAVFFDVAQRFKIKSALLCDINPELILTWRVIQQDVFKLIDKLEVIQRIYKKMDEFSQSKYYYEVRDEFNSNLVKIDFSKHGEDWIKRAAQILFMNKTCFNGLFRFNQKGEFNVPAGRYKNPKILDEQNLIKVSKILSIADIRNAGFESIENGIVKNSFVYCDPPYRPISKTSGFTSYSSNKFEDEEQMQLADLFQRLSSRGIKLMLSNSDPKNINPNDNFFDEMYKEFFVSRIPARRMINSNANKRGVINEIIVTNYSVQQ
jgi:DNA adenine methylase